MEKLLNEAIIFATNAHSGQFRKGTKIPYIVHPMETAAIASTLTDDGRVIAAAMLHDVIEDTNTTIKEIEEIFGEDIAQLVSSESENKREDLPAEFTWKMRKQETIEHLKSAPIEVKIITLSDKLSNIRAIYRDYIYLGDKLWERFNQKDKSEHYWYYKSIADCLSKFQKHQTYKEYVRLIEMTFNKK